MEIIKPQNSIEQLKNIDDSILEQLANIAISTKRDNETYKIYNKFYESQYDVDMKIERKEGNVTAKLNILQSQDDELIKTYLQMKEYNWIQILRNKMGDVVYRFYLAPDTNYMYEIIDQIVMEFLKREIPAQVKYQQERRYKECDRIVIYSDAANKDKIEKCLSDIYLNKPQFFDKSERSPIWLYKTKVPAMYLVSEKTGASYEQEFVKTIIEAKEIYCYLQGITAAKSLNELENNYDKGFLKKIIVSMLLRNGLLLSNEGKRIELNNENISTVYDYRNGELTNSSKGQEIYSEAIFMPTKEGREALLKNFYNVSNMNTQEGVTVQHLTQEERRKQIYTFFIGGDKKSKNNK